MNGTADSRRLRVGVVSRRAKLWICCVTARCEVDASVPGNEGIAATWSTLRCKHQRPAIRANFARRRSDTERRQPDIPSNMHPALVARDDGPAMQRNVPHTHVGRSERAIAIAQTHMAQTPRRAHAITNAGSSASRSGTRSTWATTSTTRSSRMRWITPC